MSSSPPLVVADRYRLVAPLGQGGMGRVWRATDVVLHREVAIKELVPPPGLTPGERQEMRERSLREARAIARLNNVNVVRVFDVLRTDADPWIVMEYVPSRSLQDTLAADGPFSPVRTAEMGLGVLNALRAAHRAGVVHRDVKPGNVLIGADGRVVLTDFGLATVPGDPNVTRTGLVLGSPAYIAPERARDGSAGPAADLWSLGATLYAAVEGASPFARPSAIATLAALATENPPPARNAGPLKPVLNGLLRKDPTHRINAEEAERLLLRAAGRRSKLSFPMSPTMRRPGVGRDRGALTTGTSATPVVPGPRPPVARPSNPPAPPVTPGRPAAGESRPVFAPGKAPVGRPADPPPARRRPAAEPPARNRPAAETPTRVDSPKVDAPRMDATRVDGPKIDATRIDGPPVQDDRTTVFGTPVTPDPARSGGLSRTSRGQQSGFTAADVAANRSKSAAPEHERSLAEATALIPRVDAKSEAPTKPQEPVKPEEPAKPGQADPTTRIALPAKRPTRTPAQGTPKPATAKVTPPADTADKTTKISEPVDKTTKIATPAVKPPAKPATEPEVKPDAEPASKTEAPAKEAEKPSAQDATQVVSPAKSSSAKGSPAPAKKATPAKTKTVLTNTAPAKAVDEPAEPATPAEETTPAEESKPAEAAPAEAPAEPETAESAPVSPVAPATVEEKAEEKAEEPEPAKAEEPKLDEVEATTTLAAAALADQTTKIAEPPPPKAKAAEKVEEDEDDDGHLSPLPAFNRPSRPAWAPEPVGQTPGVTVFGTRLTYGQAAIAGGIVLLVIVLLAVVIGRGFGDDGGSNTNQSQQPAVVPSAAGGGDSAKPSAAATTTKPAPSSAAPSTSPALSLPTTWRIYSDGTGFKIPLPKSARVSRSGSETQVRWNNRYLLIDQTDAPKANALEDWKQQERDRRGGYRNYQQVRLESVSNYFKQAADWEFYYTTSTGNNQHAVKRNIIVSDKQAYSISWYVSPDDWDAAYSDLQLLYKGFQPKK